jgi:hypothetical protein
VTQEVKKNRKSQSILNLINEIKKKQRDVSRAVDLSDLEKKEKTRE